MMARDAVMALSNFAKAMTAPAPIAINGRLTNLVSPAPINFIFAPVAFSNPAALTSPGDMRSVIFRMTFRTPTFIARPLCRVRGRPHPRGALHGVGGAHPAAGVSRARTARLLGLDPYLGEDLLRGEALALELPQDPLVRR